MIAKLLLTTALLGLCFSCTSQYSCEDINKLINDEVFCVRVSKTYCKDKRRIFFGLDTLGKEVEVGLLGPQDMHNEAKPGEWVIKKKPSKYYFLIRKSPKVTKLKIYIGVCGYAKTDFVGADSSEVVTAWYERLEGELRKNSLSSKAISIP